MEQGLENEMEGGLSWECNRYRNAIHGCSHRWGYNFEMLTQPGLLKLGTTTDPQTFARAQRFLAQTLWLRFRA